MISRLARITIGGIPRVVDLLARALEGIGFGRQPFGTSPFGWGGFGLSPFGTRPYGGD